MRQVGEPRRAPRCLRQSAQRAPTSSRWLLAPLDLRPVPPSCHHLAAQAAHDASRQLPSAAPTPWILPCGSRRQRRSLHRSLGVHLRAVRPDRAWLRQPSFLPVRSTRLPPGRARARPDPPPRPLRVGVVVAAGRSERLDLLTRAGSNSQSPGLGEKWPSALSPASCTRWLRRRGGHAHRHGRAQGSGHSGSAGTGLLRGSRKLNSRRAAWRGIGSAGAGQGEEQPWRIPTRA
jgi:hypothetical protein